MSALTDTIGDMLTRIRNATLVEHETVDIPASKVKAEIARILKEEGFIKRFSLLSRGVKKYLRIELKYSESQESVIRTIKRISKPGRRIYVQRDEIPRVLNGFGISILSTSKGLMTGRQARMAGTGGEVLCEIS